MAALQAIRQGLTGDVEFVGDRLQVCFARGSEVAPAVCEDEGLTLSRGETVPERVVVGVLW